MIHRLQHERRTPYRVSWHLLDQVQMHQHHLLSASSDRAQMFDQAPVEQLRLLLKIKTNMSQYGLSNH